MQVSSLIEELQKLEQDAEIFVGIEQGDQFKRHEIVGIERADFWRGPIMPYSLLIGEAK